MKKKSHILILLILTLNSCMGRDQQVDRNQLLGRDYRLFQGTPAWDLAKAAQDEDVDKIKELASKQKNLVNYKEPKFGQTLLHLAVQTEKYKSVKALLEAKADPNAKDDYNGKTPLMLASNIGNLGSEGDSRYLELLLRYHANPNLIPGGRNTENTSSQTALLVACEHGILSYVKILLKSGADINYSGGVGESALYCAMISENPDLVLYLLNNGADYKKPMLKNSDDKYVYILGVLKTWHFEKGSDSDKKKMAIIKFLIDHGVTK